MLAKILGTLNTFEYIISLETIEHPENSWEFIRELHRIIKPEALQY